MTPEVNIYLPGQTFAQIAEQTARDDYAEQQRVEVVVQFTVEGIHCWPDAEVKQPRVAFLSSPHRHIFFIKAKKLVSGTDRELEIIRLKRAMISWLFAGKARGAPLDFGALSCEQIAVILGRAFQLSECQVLEDDENGASVHFRVHFE